MTAKEDIINYVVGSIYMPIENREQIESMVILHYDLPDSEARIIVGEALVKALESYRRKEKIAEGDLRNVRRMIDKLRGWTPELSSPLAPEVKE